MMSKSTGYVCGGERSAKGDLITDCTASGVKGAGTGYGVLHGTGEVRIVLLTVKDAVVKGYHEIRAAD